MIKVKCEVNVYEFDGEAIDVGTSMSININSHWNRDKMIIIDTGNHKYTVVAQDLKTAIENAKQSNRFG